MNDAFPIYFFDKIEFKNSITFKRFNLTKLANQFKHNNTKMQTKQDIISELENIFNETTAFIEQVDDSIFNKSIDKKWSIAENIDHLSITQNVTALSFNMPKMLLKQLFKTNNRISWNYDETVWKYQRTLNSGGKASFAFQPKVSLAKNKKIVLYFWKKSCDSFLNAAKSWNEEDLDIYIIPHPLIGKITMREFLFFSVYHVKHHLQTIKNIAEK